MSLFGIIFSLFGKASVRYEGGKILSISGIQKLRKYPKYNTAVRSKIKVLTNYFARSHLLAK